MATKVMLDTGPVWALLDRADQYHKRSRSLLRPLRHSGAELILPRIAQIEICGHATRTLQKFVEPEHRKPFAQRLVRELDRVGFRELDHDQIDFTNARALWEQYVDWPIDYPDTLMAVTARRLSIPFLWTFDASFQRFLAHAMPGIRPIRELPGLERRTE